MDQSKNHDSRRMTRPGAFEAAESIEKYKQSALSLSLLFSLLLLMGAGGV